MTGNANVGAIFDYSSGGGGPVRYGLGIDKSGLGNGTVTSSPAGISCGSTCLGFYDPGTAVTLTATADSQSAFNSWTGCDSVSGAICYVTMNYARNVTTNFKTKYLVTSNVSGSGTVTFGSTGVTCGNCGVLVTEGTNLTLTANPGTGHAFGSWSGDCSGTNPSCTIIVNGPKTVTAAFTPLSYTLTATIAGNGTAIYGATGYVIPNTGSIVCMAPLFISCSGTYAYGNVVTLMVQPKPGFYFDHWEQSCIGTNPSCSITILGDTNVRAVFQPYPVLLLHGIYSDDSIYTDKEANNFTGLKRKLQDYGFTVYTIGQALGRKGYTNNGSHISTTRGELMQALDWVKSQLGTNGKVNIVAHSMGGTITRSYIQSSFYNTRQDVARFIMLGTPNYGSPIAYNQLAPILGPAFLGADEPFGDGGRRDLWPISNFIQDLNANVQDYNATFKGTYPAIIGGTKSTAFAKLGKNTPSLRSSWTVLVREGDSVVPIRNMPIPNVPFFAAAGVAHATMAGLKGYYDVPEVQDKIVELLYRDYNSITETPTFKRITALPPPVKHESYVGTTKVYLFNVLPGETVNAIFRVPFKAITAGIGQLVKSLKWNFWTVGTTTHDGSILHSTLTAPDSTVITPANVDSYTDYDYDEDIDLTTYATPLGNPDSQWSLSVTLDPITPVPDTLTVEGLFESRRGMELLTQSSEYTQGQSVPLRIYLGERSGAGDPVFDIIDSGFYTSTNVQAEIYDANDNLVETVTLPYEGTGGAYSSALTTSTKNGEYHVRVVATGPFDTSCPDMGGGCDWDVERTLTFPFQVTP